MNEIFLIGDVGADIKLKDLVDELKQYDQDKEVTLHISSAGGNLLEGKAIYRYLVKLRNEGWQIATTGLGTIASMGTIIFLAGNKELRQIHDDDFFYLHLPENMVFGNSDDMEKQLEQLRTLENEMAEIYASETNIDKIKALELMRKADRISATELINLGFASKIIPKVTAKFNFKNRNMTGHDKNKIQMLLSALGNLFNGTSMKLIQDVNGVEIDFFELEPEAEIKVGDKAKVNNEVANGEFIVVKDEKKYKYVFKDGVLQEITEVTENADDEKDQQIADLTAKVNELEQKLQAKETAQAEMKQKFNDLQALIKTELGVTGSYRKPDTTTDPNGRDLQILK